MATVLRVLTPTQFAHLLEERLTLVNLVTEVEVLAVPNRESARYVRITLPCEHKGKIIEMIDVFAQENKLKHTLVGTQPKKDSH